MTESREGEWRERENSVCVVDVLVLAVFQHSTFQCDILHCDLRKPTTHTHTRTHTHIHTALSFDTSVCHILLIQSLISLTVAFNLPILSFSV